MSEHRVSVRWARAGQSAKETGRNTNHEWVFSDVARLPASAAPEYGGTPDYADPEQALVAAVSSCHMLTFLAIAAKEGREISSYTDDATGTLARNDEGKWAVTHILLRPKIEVAGPATPDRAELARLHDRAHAACFIARSLKAKIVIDPR